MKTVVGALFVLMVATSAVWAEEVGVTVGVTGFTQDRAISVSAEYFHLFMDKVTLYANAEYKFNVYEPSYSELSGVLEGGYNIIGPVSIVGSVWGMLYNSEDFKEEFISVTLTPRADFDSAFVQCGVAFDITPETKPLFYTKLGLTFTEWLSVENEMWVGKDVVTVVPSVILKQGPLSLVSKTAFGTTSVLDDIFVFETTGTPIVTSVSVKYSF